MSSAILYLAIIAIWACVLIPRWLKRDSVRGAAAPQEAGPSAAPLPAGTVLDDAEVPDAGIEYEDAAESSPAPAPASRTDSRRRVLAARRRLLWMMLGLEAAGAVLALTHLAAWWVIAPPTVMLAGYLLLLRAAAQADAERDARDQADQEAARDRARRPRGAWQATVASEPAPVATPVAYAAAPVPEDYEDLGTGRDFAPGLRYASPGDASDNEAYDQYTENRLRAVGD